MKHKLIRDGVFTASTVLLISGLINLLPNQKPQLFVIAGTLGLTGTTLVKKEDNSELEEKIEQDTEGKIKQALNTINRQMQSELEQADDKILALEQKVEKLIEAAIQQSNRTNQSARDKIKVSLEKKIAQSPPQSQSQAKLKLNQPDCLSIIELLKLKNIKVEANTSKHSSKQIILAKHLADHYDSLKDFYTLLKNNINHSSGFEYCLKEKHCAAIRIHTVFGSELKKIGYYPEYRYVGRYTKTMYVPPCQNQVGKQFIKGGWFEVCILNMILEDLRKKSLKSKFLLNPFASFYKDNELYRKHELDLLFAINNNLIWIECKSGQVLDEELQKYSDNNQQFLKIPKRNALVVCFKISESDAAIKTRQYPGITVINPDSLIKSIQAILDNEPIPLPTLEFSVEIADVQKTDGSTALATIDNHPAKLTSTDSWEILASA